MANRLTLTPPLRRLAGLLFVGGLLLTLTFDAQAQATKDKEKEKETKPGDTKTSELKSPGKDSLFTPNVSNEDAIKIINELIAAKWKDDKGGTLYQPAEKCSDYEFIRRASLDIIGRIAKVEEINRYMKDPQATRRKLLVDRLLASPEYTKNWSTIWTHWLMTRTGDKLYKDQIQLWLEEEMFAQETMSDQGHDREAAHRQGQDQQQRRGQLHPRPPRRHEDAAGPGCRDASLWVKEGQFDMVPVTSRSIRLFLGYQIQCTQCHDHPFNAEWKQKHFWGFNAFFRQSERVGQPPNRMNGMMGQNQPMELKDNDEYNKPGLVYFEKRNGVFLPSRARVPGRPRSRRCPRARRAVKFWRSTSPATRISRGPMSTGCGATSSAAA